MPRKPKPKNTLSAGQRAALYEKEQSHRLDTEFGNNDNGKDLSFQENGILKIKAEESSDPVREDANRIKKEKKKPQYACVKVDFSIPLSNIKPMHGICNGPVSQESDISSLYREIGVPFVRLHDTDHNISRYAVDISRVFPDFNADENDPSNYRFAYTDKYISAVYTAGARVIYRLGESIDPGGVGGHCTLPKDIDKWISICVHIIRHYNDYWANGFAYGLDYFEVWNEPDNADCIDTHENKEVFEFYRRVSKGLKLYNPDLKVGGMAFTGYNDMSRDFVKYCAKNKAPLDFFSFHCYCADPEDIEPDIQKILPLLYNLGFADTQVFLDEWNFIDSPNKNVNPWVFIKNEYGKFSSECRDIFESQKSIKGAAFAAAFMLKLNAQDKMSAACYYDGQPSISRWCGICDRYGNPTKTFYSFKAYGKLYRAKNGVACVSEQYDGMLHTGIYACAALDDNKKGYVLLASFDGCGMVDLRLDMLPENVYTADIYMTDGVKNLELCDSVPLSGLKKRLLLNMSAYGVALIEIY